MKDTAQELVCEHLNSQMLGNGPYNTLAVIRRLATACSSTRANRSGLKKHREKRPDAPPPVESKLRHGCTDNGRPLLQGALLAHLFWSPKRLKRRAWSTPPGRFRLSWVLFWAFQGKPTPAQLRAISQMGPVGQAYLVTPLRGNGSVKSIH